jgi:putative spermidine/putrescine transport system permease protein
MTATPKSRYLALLALPAALLIVGVYAAPMYGLGRMSFNETGPTGAMVNAFSLDIWAQMMGDGFTWELTLNSLWLSFVATTGALILGYPLALFLFRTDSRFRGLLIVLAVAPMLVSGVVRVFGWLAILGDRGFVNFLLMQSGLASAPIRLVYNFTGAAIGLTESLMPYMILALLAGFGRLDRTLEEASASLGAPVWRTFARVTLPLSLPAILLGWLLCFVLAMSAYVTPKLLGGGRVFLLATEIYDQAITTVNWPLAAALALYTLVVLILFLGAYSVLSRKVQA